MVLIERSTTQRAALAAAASPLAHKLAGFDRVVAALRGRPLLLCLAAGAVGLLGPSRLLAWAARAAAAYSLLRRI